MNKPESGRVSYGDRAFHQDATEAMRGDIVRALIETLTNSDDAYGDGEGKIRVEIEHRRGPWTAITRDRAKGMTANQMREAFVKLGGRTSGFESGQKVRGNLGRGAKDLAAFGTVHFESICDDKYSKLTLRTTGDYVLNPADKKVDEALRKQLGIPRGNGTVVTMEILENIRRPQHAKLAEKLSKHFQLRDILSHPRREVTLVNVGKDKGVRLRYAYPSLPIAYQGDLAIPGYPDASASLVIYRNDERYDDAPSDDSRPAGILITGHRAIYENTLFRFENNPMGGWFSGRLECPYIDQLARDYDQRLTTNTAQLEGNPIPIISRRRDGLKHEHPFFRALAKAVEGPLGELIREEEQKAKNTSGKQSEKMRRTLDALGRDIARLVDEDLRNLEEEGLDGSGQPGSNVIPIRLIPEQVVLYMGEDKTLTVQVRADLNIKELNVELDPEGVIAIVGDTHISLVPHKKRPTEILVGQIQVRPMVEDKETLLSVTGDSHSAVALVEVRPERVSVEIPEPETLQFERESYRVAHGKKKTLKIYAPVELVDALGKDVQVVSSDAGAVVLAGGKCVLQFDEEFEFYSGDVEVDARKLGTKATITARLGSTAATCNLAITRDEEGPSIRFEFDDEEAGKFRAVVGPDSGGICIRIKCGNPVTRRYQGASPDYLGRERSVFKALVAEIVADQAARMILERKFPVSGAERLDAARFYGEHYSYMHKYLHRCHKILVNDDELTG
jgi:hypothetical protein